MYRAIDLSKYIVSKCIDDGHPISNLQLQKILYYIQKDFLSRKNVAAFSDDIEAWQFGPVVPDVYYYYCGYGAMPISFSRERFDIEPVDKKAVDAIVESKRSLDPWTMVAEIRNANDAWIQSYKNGLSNREVISVVRCRDCAHARKSENAFDFDGRPLCECAYMRLPNRWHEYCSWGQRKDGDAR